MSVCVLNRVKNIILKLNFLKKMHHLLVFVFHFLLKSYINLENIFVFKLYIDKIKEIKLVIFLLFLYNAYYI